MRLFPTLSHSSRTRRLTLNALLAVVAKVGSMAISFLLIPLTLNYVDAATYGTYITLTTVMMWLDFFDIGFCNGLRNRLAEALAKGEQREAQSLVSTTYAALTLIFGTVMVAAVAAVWWFPMSTFLHLDASMEHVLKVSVALVLVYYCVTFVVKTLAHIFLALQHTALSGLIGFVGQVFVLLVLIALIHCHVAASLPILIAAYLLPSLVVWLVASVIAFRGPLSALRPRLALAQRREARALLSLGGRFFFVQIAALIQFQTACFLIAHLFSMEKVTSYNLCYRYFGILYMFFFLMIEPLWSATTEAWTKGDIAWIQRSVKRYLGLAAVLTLGGVVMLYIAPWVYAWWINNHVDTPVDIPFTLSFWMWLMYVGQMVGMVFCMFINGIGALKLQIISSLITPFFYVALAIVLSHTRLDVACMPVAALIANGFGLVVAPLQYYMVVYKHKGGIWRA